MLLSHDFCHLFPVAGILACKLVNFLPVQCITTSVMTLVAISYERHRAIVRHHIPPLSTRSAKMVCLSIWIISLLISIPTIMEYNVFEENSDSTYIQEVNTTDSITVAVTSHQFDSVSKLQCGRQHSDKTYVLSNGLFLMAVIFVGPLCFISYYYGCIIKYICFKTQRVSASYTRLSHAFHC